MNPVTHVDECTQFNHVWRDRQNRRQMTVETGKDTLHQFELR